MPDMDKTPALTEEQLRARYDDLQVQAEKAQLRGIMDAHVAGRLGIVKPEALAGRGISMAALDELNASYNRAIANQKSSIENLLRIRLELIELCGEVLEKARYEFIGTEDEFADAYGTFWEKLRVHQDGG